LLVVCLAACSSHDAKDREIDLLRGKLVEAENRLAEAEAKLAAIDAQRATLPALPAPRVDAAMPPPDPGEARTAKLRVLAGYFEANAANLSRDLRISIADTLDEYGRVRDPAALCSELQAAYTDRYGEDGAQLALVRAFGAELGTQVFRGSLCDGPSVERGLVPPSSSELNRAFTERIEHDAPGWSRRLDIPLSELVDETGHVRDIGAVGHREHQRLDQRHDDWDRAIQLFGNELGTAVHFDRIGR
jgi:hypothetical protein